MKHLLPISALGFSLLMLGACSDSNDTEHNSGDHMSNSDHMMNDDDHMMGDVPKVYIISPKDGDTVTSPVTVVFGLTGMEVAPAGTGSENSGHHHLVVDGNLPELDKPMGGDVKHFGKGQTETLLELAAGEHTLQLIMGDKFHTPHANPVISEKITITVE